MSDVLFSPDILRFARFSDDGIYRYSLSRQWSESSPLGWIMLNPSTADAVKDDPTIRRTISFSKAWGYGGVQIRNIFAFRATRPADMFRAVDPVGPENDNAIIELIAVCPMIIAAWGVHGIYRNRGKQVVDLIHEHGGKLMCLGHCAGRGPRHPLYVHGETKLEPFAPEAA